LLAADGVDDQRVAEHLMRAPPRGDAVVVATLRRAGEAARRLGSLTIAARLLTRALAEPPAPLVVDAIEFELGRALLDGGEEDGARVLARLAQRAPEASLRFGAAGHLARRLAQDGRGSKAVAVLRTTLETWMTRTVSCDWSCSSSLRSSPPTPTSDLMTRRCG
jgi:hypothetical protein